MCDQTGSTGNPTCWENSGQKGGDTFKCKNNAVWLVFDGTVEAVNEIFYDTFCTFSPLNLPVIDC